MARPKHGKTIKLFLMDGDPNGRISCELSNWTGKAYRIPRGMIKECTDRDELRKPCVYLLFGNADFPGSRPSAYIGEAENAYNRLVQHVAEKEFWNEAVLFISKDEHLNKALIKYLESRLFELAQEAGRYELQNGNRPTRSTISEPDQAEMEEFIEHVTLLVNTLGFKIFEPLTRQMAGETDPSLLHIKGARGASGKGKRVVDGFVVLKGSQPAAEPVASFPRGFRALRDELIGKGIIREESGKLLFTRDHLFSSPSAAAAVLLGRSANGLLEWKDDKGRSLKEIESAEIERTSC